jgi:hypothetical protein
MGIAVIFKKTLSVLCLATLISGCIKKETPDFGRNDEVNKAYTEDKNGEMIFYDLKKPAIEAKIEVVKGDHEDLSKLLLNDLKGKAALLNEINIKEQQHISHITIKLNKISEFGDGYLDQMTHDVSLILKTISNRLKNKNVSASFIQVFDDGSSLNLNFKGNDLSTVGKEDLFNKMKISTNEVKGDAKKLLALICDSHKTDNTDYKFCNNDVEDEKQVKLNMSKLTNTITNKDGIEKIIEENSELTTLKKEHGLSEDQKKILQDAGFEITLNE